MMSTIMGPASGAIPKVHPAVAKFFAERRKTDIQLFPVGLDVKQTECVRCLFADGNRASIIADWHPSAIPVFFSTDAQFESRFRQICPKVSIVFDGHDKGRKFDFLGISDELWQFISQNQLQVIYLKLQVHNAVNYSQLNRLPEQVHVLSWPLLLGGSRFHLTVQEDFEGDCLFSKTLNPNPSSVYEYDWSCVGSPTSDDRKAAFDLLEKNPAGGFLTVSKPGHADANAATVPMEKYLQISRASRICISLNGRGPWCLKDGELFANDCFILRQWHPTIDLNPLTPKDGVHWRIFKTENLTETIKECLADPAGCNRIRRSGFDNFRQAMRENLWSSRYAGCLESFLKSAQKSAWGELAFA